MTPTHDEPAFPQKTKIDVKVEYDDSDAMFDDRGTRIEKRDKYLPGLTKREYFASFALMGLLQQKLGDLFCELKADTFAESVAKASFAYADAMIAELEKERG